MLVVGGEQLMWWIAHDVWRPGSVLGKWCMYYGLSVGIPMMAAGSGWWLSGRSPLFRIAAVALAGSLLVIDIIVGAFFLRRAIADVRAGYDLDCTEIARY